MTADDGAPQTRGVVNTHLLDAWRTIVFLPDDPHGPLPPLLVVLTFVTGLIDAFSYLELGRVFVANMTGNVVFLSFALGGAPGFIWWASVLGIFTFSGGALIGGRVAHRFGAHRARHLFAAAAAQTVAVAAGLVIALVMPRPYDDVAIIVLIVLLGVGMGIQNATARSLAVPDLTTTVLTLTITGISADSSVAGGRNSRIGRRLVSVATMFLGGLCGAALIIAGYPAISLIIATLALLAVTITAARLARSTAAWTSK